MRVPSPPSVLDVVSPRMENNVIGVYVRVCSPADKEARLAHKGPALSSQGKAGAAKRARDQSTGTETGKGVVK